MDLFRRKQKLIFWIVTLIIVPSFVLVWGVSGSYGRGAGGGAVPATIGTVNGKPFSYQDFEGFRRRIQAAVGGVPLHFAGAPGTGTRAEEAWKYAFAYSLLQDAEKAGARASDLQVGTFLENTHPVISQAYDAKDPKAIERAVDQYCRQMQMTRADFLQGVRDWRTIGNYILDDSNLAAVNDDTVFAFYAINKAECVVKRVKVVPTPAITEQAKKDVMSKPADELDREARNFIAAHSDDPHYRQPPEWRLSYVWMPQATESLARPATDEEIESYYNANRATFGNKPLADVKEQVKAELARQDADRQTLRNFTIDVDPQLRAQTALSLEELAKLTQLAKYGVKTGDTGPNLLPTADAVAKLPAGAATEIARQLEVLDAAPEAVRNEYLTEWKSGYNLTNRADGRPVKVDDGYIRMRILDYVPSRPVDVNGPDGKIKPELYEHALSDLVSERVAALVRDKAMEMEAAIRKLLDARRDGQPAPDATVAAEFDKLPTETIPYLQIADSNYDLGRVTVGDMVGPIPYLDPAGGGEGQELVVMTDRRIPTRAAFDAETEEMRQRYRQLSLSNYRGNFGYTYSVNGPVAIVQPSPALMGAIADRYNKGQIALSREFIGAEASEG